MTLFFTTFIQFFFLFAPFFVVSMFLALTKRDSPSEKRRIIRRAIFSAATVVVILFFFGTALFGMLGITLDAFRVGAGSLLFLSAVSLVNSGERSHAMDLPENTGPRDDIAVVPLAIPTIIGPATIGAILVISADLTTAWDTVVGLVAVMVALGALMILLFLASRIEKIMGKTGLNILSKITGLVLAAMASQIVFTGARNLWFGV
ncbi:MAG: MarC family protein [Natronospirillum sp.]